MSKFAGIIKRLFVLFYIIYATSSVIGEVDRMPAGSITADRTTISIKILNLDYIMTLLFDADDSREEADNEVGDDFLVKKFRCVPGGQSLGKQMLSESHTQSSLLAEQQDIASHQTSLISHDIITPAVPTPFEGYGTQHSGLAPPYLLS